MGFHFTMLCGQIFVHMPKKKHFLNILPLSSSTSPANSAIRVSYRFGGSGSTRLLHHSAWSERDEIFSPHLRGSFWPVWPILSEGRLPRRIQKNFFPFPRRWDERQARPEVGSEPFVGMSLHPSPP